MRATTIIVFLTLIITKSLFSQDFRAVDEKVKSYPHSFRNPENLAERINTDFTQPEEKARAIYAWIALNIAYDVKAFNSGTKRISYSYTTPEEKTEIENKLEADLAKQTLKKKRAVCQGYATLFKILADLTSIECEIINGTARTRPQDIGKKTTQTNHAWNAIKIKDGWKLIDATWGAGYLDAQSGQFVKEYTDIYFFTEPEKFFLKHYPENPDWLLIKKSASDFAQLPLFYNAYLNSKIEIIEPTKGTIKIPKNNLIKIVLRNCENEKVSFGFNNDKKSIQPEPQLRKGLCYFEIKAGSAAYLTIYINHRAFASYKLERH